MASGHVNRANRPNTWLHRPTLQTGRKSLPTRSRPHMALIGGAGRPQVGRLLKVDRQCVRCGRSSQAGPEAELPRSMNAAYSRLGLVGDARSKLNRMTRQRGAEGTLRACIPSCRQLARSPPQVIRSGVNDGEHPRQRVQN